MSHLSLVSPKRQYLLIDVWTDFLLSRQAKLVSPSTIRTYKYTAGKFLEWLLSIGITDPLQITARHVRRFLSGLSEKGRTDSYIHCNARVIKTFVRFLLDEVYIEEPVIFEMPKIARKRLPVLSVCDLQTVLNACASNRDKAIVLLLVDSGLRAAEALSLNWGDLEISSGIVRVYRGKGGKARTVVIGVNTRRALLKYKRHVSHNDRDPLIQTQSGRRLTYSGLLSLMVRLSDRCGVYVRCHALRRSFAIFSLRNGMSIFHLQGLLGHSSLEMARSYAQMVEEDLVKAHQDYGPIDKILSN